MHLFQSRFSSTTLITYFYEFNENKTHLAITNRIVTTIATVQTVDFTRTIWSNLFIQGCEFLMWDKCPLYLPLRHWVISLEHWPQQAASSAAQLEIHSTKLASQRSVQAKFKSGTLNSFWFACIKRRQRQLTNNLQTFGERIKIIRLTRD